MQTDIQVLHLLCLRDIKIIRTYNFNSTSLIFRVVTFINVMHFAALRNTRIELNVLTLISVLMLSLSKI
jgi:hypothetical protein